MYTSDLSACLTESEAFSGVFAHNGHVSWKAVMILTRPSLLPCPITGASCPLCTLWRVCGNARGRSRGWDAICGRCQERLASRKLRGSSHTVLQVLSKEARSHSGVPDKLGKRRFCPIGAAVCCGGPVSSPGRGWLCAFSLCVFSGDGGGFGGGLCEVSGEIFVVYVTTVSIIS